ncbi:regulator of chromosome condensation (RCC1) repeat domain-containing protein [Phthorimaea operculella]|nr:regulator of chromosome condensation (RCC1) repeat domain-containing protein [Phthorimaea operculella]
MPAARGVKRTASKSSTSTASVAPKNKKKRNVVQLEVPTLPKRRGSVFTCGQGDVGQLGLGEDVIETSRFKHVAGLGEKIVDVCAGGMHTVAIDSDGKVWTFGCNDEGALGRATSGDGEEGSPAPVSLPARAVAVSAGDSHSAALLADGQVYAWGAFRVSIEEPRCLPGRVRRGLALRSAAGRRAGVRVGRVQALLADGQVYAWGAFRVSIEEPRCLPGRVRRGLALRSAAGRRAGVRVGRVQGEY